MDEPLSPDVRPLVGVSACVRDIEGRAFHAVADQYARAVAEGAGCQPLIIPALHDTNDTEALIGRLDGLVLTGSPSNVEPHHYAGTPSRDGVLHDPWRDQSTLPLIRRAIDAGLPLLGICRGLQEINVAFGGTLHQHLQEMPGRLDHRQDTSLPNDERYGLRHEITLTDGGQLAGLLGKTQTRVNTLHEQGVDRLADGLDVEAVAPDGTIEAFRVDGAAGFALAVQWHPEFRVLENPDSLAIFRAFGDAVRRYTAASRQSAPRARAG
jgi:putative glutamine amidotransferase